MTALIVIELRARGAPFQELAKGPWALSIAIAVHWQGNAEALARFSRWSSRAVRDQADALERGGFIRVRRERRHDGWERIFYSPGRVTLSALADFVERAGLVGPDRRTRTGGDKEDEDVARLALAERMATKHPNRPTPNLFDAGEHAMVGACVAALAGDAEEKLLAQRDAVACAFLVSKDGPPTVRFIWEKLDHFLDHVERGRRRRAAEERAARRGEAVSAMGLSLKTPSGERSEKQAKAARGEARRGRGAHRRGRA